MGWTEYNANHYKMRNGREVVDVKAECDSLIEDENGMFKVLRSSLVGSTYYAAVQKQKSLSDYNEETKRYETVEIIPERERETFAVVFLTSVDNKRYYNFCYKDMDESCGPCECKCPIVILNLLTPTTNKFALAWRQRCRDYAKTKQSPTSIGKLPVGSIIKYTLNNGEEMVIEKCSPAYQFKTNWWYDAKHHQYVSKKRIPETYEVVKVGEGT